MLGPSSSSYRFHDKGSPRSKIGGENRKANLALVHHNPKSLRSTAGICIERGTERESVVSSLSAEDADRAAKLGEEGYVGGSTTKSTMTIPMPMHLDETEAYASIPGLFPFSPATCSSLAVSSMVRAAAPSTDSCSVLRFWSFTVVQRSMLKRRLAQCIKSCSMLR